MNCCLICTEKYLTDFICLYDDRYGYPGVFDLIRCRNCGHTFLQNTFSSGQLTELYSQYYPRSNFDVSEYRPYKNPQGFCAWLNGDANPAYT